jgi:hypothetical protein
LINIDRPEQNNGMLVIRGDNIKVEDDKEVVDALTFIYPLTDPNDLLYLKPVLLRDGSGIALEEPTITEYFWKRTAMIHDQETDMACDKTETEHRINSAALKKVQSRKTRKVLLEFPEGLTCKADHFSNKPSKLKVHYRELSVPIRERAANIRVVQYAWWKVAISGRERTVETGGSWDDEDPFADATDRMNQALSGMAI